MSKTPRVDAVAFHAFPVTGSAVSSRLVINAKTASAIERENASLRSDIERHVKIAADLATENAALRARLEACERALGPFARLARLDEALDLSDAEPMSRFIPARWPTMADCRAAEAARSAP